MFNWFDKKNPEETVVTNTSSTRLDWMAEIRKREAAEKKRKEKWSKELKQKMNNNYTYSSNLGQWTIDDRTTTTIVETNTTLKVNGTLEVDGRNIIEELDEIKATLLIVTRDKKLEEQYPELKEAYDNYMEIKRSLSIAEKLYNTGK